MRIEATEAYNLFHDLPRQDTRMGLNHPVAKYLPGDGLELHVRRASAG